VRVANGVQKDLIPSPHCVSLRLPRLVATTCKSDNVIHDELQVADVVGCELGNPDEIDKGEGRCFGTRRALRPE